MPFMYWAHPQARIEFHQSDANELHDYNTYVTSNFSLSKWTKWTKRSDYRKHRYVFLLLLLPSRKRRFTLSQP
jgi:hypothetical protein